MSTESILQDKPQPLIGTLSRNFLLCGIVVIVVLACYAYYPSLQGGFIMDDDSLLTESNIIRSSDGLLRFWFTSEAAEYYPVTYSILWCEWRLWGMNTLGYHIVSLLLHIISALLLWTILRKLALPGAFLAALIFAVHPVNVESVAWIVQLRNMLAMLFLLLTFWTYLQAELQAPPVHNPHYDSIADRWYKCSLLMFLLAMLSKGSVAVFPILLLMVVWQRRSITKRDLNRVMPFFVIAVGLTLVNIWFQTHGMGTEVRAATFVERILGAGGVVWFYLYKAFVPIHLIFVYPQWHIESGDLLWWLPLSAVLAVSGLLWLCRNTWCRPILVAWGFFLVSLIPVMGFVDVGFMRHSLIADHYQHLAIIGLIVLTAGSWGYWRHKSSSAMRWICNALAVTAVIALTFLTHQQSQIYADPAVLYRTTVENNPKCWLAHNNLAIILFQAGDVPEAIEHYQECLKENPDYALAHNNLAVALESTGNIPEAKEHYERAIQLNPNYAQAHNGLGAVLAMDGQFAEAAKHFQKAVEVKFDYARAYFNLAQVYAELKEPVKAKSIAQQALEIAKFNGQMELVRQVENWLDANSTNPLDKTNVNTSEKP